MSSLLSSLGLTAPSPPPASAYTDQKAEIANIADAKSQLADTVSGISLALSTAKMIGVDPSYTQSLEALNQEAASLSNANLTSAQLTARTDALNKKLTAAKDTQEASQKKQAIDDMTAVVKEVSDRVKVVKADKTSPAENVKQYEELEKTANDALTALNGPPPPEGKEAPTYPLPDEIRSQMDGLDTALEAAQNKEFNWERFWKNLGRNIIKYMTYVAIACGAILGGIIMSNKYAEESFWLIKVFYFVYGAGFFPFSLLFGAAKPPFWVSTLIPIVPSVPPAPAADPEAAAPDVPPIESTGPPGQTDFKGLLARVPKVTLGGGEQEGGAFGLPSLSSLTSKVAGAASAVAGKAKAAASTVADKAKAAASTVVTKAKTAVKAAVPTSIKGAMTGVAGVAGAAGLAAVAAKTMGKPAAPLPVPGNVPPPPAITPPTAVQLPEVNKPAGGLFSYTLVDPSNPTDKEKSSQSYLRVMAITNLSLLGISAIYYGVDKLILKNRV